MSTGPAIFLFADGRNRIYSRPHGDLPLYLIGEFSPDRDRIVNRVFSRVRGDPVAVYVEEGDMDFWGDPPAKILQQMLRAGL